MKGKSMNNQFDELTKNLAQSVTRRGVLKPFCAGLAGLALALASLAPSAVQAASEVPFRAIWETQISIAPLEPPLFAVSGLGVGKALHLGAMSAQSITEVVNLATGEGAASYRFTAANGDEVLITFVFLAIPTSPTAFSIEGVWQVTGGTGRFEGASGSGTYIGQAEFVGPADAVGTFALEGTISSPKQP
jgi:hypothetical protein